jgi:hypothetical protein
LPFLYFLLRGGFIGVAGPGGRALLAFALALFLALFLTLILGLALGLALALAFFFGGFHPSWVAQNLLRGVALFLHLVAALVCA